MLFRMKIKIEMKNYILLFLLAFASTGFGHKYYVSIAELEYDQDLKIIEGSIKMTAHDFEAILENKFNQRIHIEELSDTSEVGMYIEKYLWNHFKIISKGVELKPNFVGKEVSLRQELFLYFTFSEVKDPKDIKIINRLLFDVFPAQQNIVHYKYGEQTKSVTLVSSKTSDIIQFD